MNSYAIMRINKHKMGTVSRINRHHERLKQEYKSNPDIDLSKVHEDYHIKECSGSYRELITKRIQEVGCKVRKDSVVMQDCLALASPDWINKLTLEEQKEFFRHAYRFFAEKFGEDNIISAVVHMDETTPHMHLIFVPITEDGRLSSKKLIGGPQGLIKLQDDYYEHLHSKYPDITRGIPKRVTHRKHLPVYLFKNAAELFQHYEEIQEAIESIGLINNKKKKEEAMGIIVRYIPAMVKLTEQLKSVDKYVSSLEDLISQEQAKNNEAQKQQDEAVNAVRTQMNARIKTVEGQLSDTVTELQARKDEVEKLQWQIREVDKVVKKLPVEALDELVNKKVLKYNPKKR